MKLKYLSGRSRWFYILPWILGTALTWSSYRLLIEPFSVNLAQLNFLGVFIEALFASVLVGLLQGIILKLYLKDLSIVSWASVTFLWFIVANRTLEYVENITPLPTSPYFLGVLAQFFFLVFIISQLLAFPIVSWLILRRYSLRSQLWLVFSFPIFFYVIAASSPGTLADWFIPDIAVLFDRQYGPVESRYPFSGINIGIATSLIFVINPKTQ